MLPDDDLIRSKQVLEEITVIHGNVAHHEYTNTTAPWLLLLLLLLLLLYNSHLLGLGSFFSFLTVYTVGFLGRGISPSQVRYLHTEQTHTDIHALSGIRTHDPSIRTSEDSSCFRPRGHCDLPQLHNCPCKLNDFCHVLPKALHSILNRVEV
jgi:hypothetical protein